MIKAIDLYNILKQYNEEELKELNIVIETNRLKNYRSGYQSIVNYLNLIEEYPSQIRLIGVIEND